MGEEKLDKTENEDRAQTDDNAVNEEQSNKRRERPPGEQMDKRPGGPDDKGEQPAGEQMDK